MRASWRGGSPSEGEVVRVHRTHHERLQAPRHGKDERMGDEVADTTFSRENRQAYRDKVKLCLDVFARMLAESRFDPDRRSIGMEIELNLTEATGDPAL